MQNVLRTVRTLVFGAAVLGSLGFGASQAAASSTSRLDCDGEGQVYLGTCPGPTRDCGAYCAGGVGACLNGCCNCRF
ncbi:MAG TPA: hypothetical protein VGC13_28710 [Longimicrobium sp.]|jgi:hypothetical protein|uniref:hypothetical protein n=1 Tax=Longimicrobium sp. TaxID=2029185 RepID=UPI002EDB649B